MATATQLHGRTRFSSLDDVVATDEETGGEIFLLHDVLSEDREDPAAKATRKMDWEEFVAALPERENAVIQFMTEGKTLREAAHALRVSDSAMQSSKRDLRVKILEFMGMDILTEVQRRPQWKEGLDATREGMAVRYERCR
jgi:DNA-directed RNA polymerase specialized sigma subunit